MPVSFVERTQVIKEYKPRLLVSPFPHPSKENINKYDATRHLKLEDLRCTAHTISRAVSYPCQQISMVIEGGIVQ